MGAEHVNEEHFSVSTGARNSGVGARQSNYVYVDDGVERSDTQQSLEEMKSFTSDEGAKAGVDKLIAYAGAKNYEHPYMEESIQVDVAVWPDLFWPRSKVALSLPGEESQYERLRVCDR